jgi:DNA polymerase family A
MACKPGFCDGCPINHVTGTDYVPLHSVGGKTLVVGDAPRSEDALHAKPHFDGIGAWLYSLMAQARLDRRSIDQINVIGCHPPGDVFPGSKNWTLTPRADARYAVEYCRQHHLGPVLAEAAAGGQYTKVIALGENALQATTPRFGVTFWRGSALPLRDHLSEGPKVVVTLDPAMVAKQANMFSVCVGDLKKGLVLPPEFYNLRPTLEDVREFTAPRFAFDLEWDEMGEPTICGLTDRYYHTIVVPWAEPFLPELKRIFEGAETLIGHNIVGADMKYILRMGWTVTAELSDTILKHHLVFPDLRHALSVAASISTSKVFWKGKFEYEGESVDEEEDEVKTGVQWKTFNTPDAIPREFGGYGGCDSSFEAFRLYNARDTDAEFQIDFPLTQLLKQHGLEGIYRNVSLPAAQLCQEMGDRGLRIDHSRISIVQAELTKDIAALDLELPEGLRSHEVEVTRMRPAPPGTYAPKSRKCKGYKTLKTRHPTVEIVFTQPGEQQCPVCGALVTAPKLALRKTVKVQEMERVHPWHSNAQIQAHATSQNCRDVINRKTDRPTTGRNARKVWSRAVGAARQADGAKNEFTIIDQLKKKFILLNSFAKPGLLQIKRVLFNLMVFGTATGRLSCSGREPAKLNLQNQPKSIRHIFVPDEPGYAFIEADFSGGENNLTAFLAKDTERLERLRDPEYDEHAELGSLFFECEVSKTSNKHLRPPAKIFNHGKTYGMGILTMAENFMMEGFDYTVGKIREFDRLWRELNAGTAAWQDATVGLAGKQGFLRNAFGRMRWFQSRDYGTKALAFLPSSTLADIALRVMIAIHASRFQRELSELGVRVICDLPPGWRLVLQIHDSILLCGPAETKLEAARLLKAVMEQPWRELDGFSLKVEVMESEESWGSMKVIEV